MARRILVVDDEPDILHEVVFILRKRGYDVVTAVNGREGLEQAQRLQPALIVLDLCLPLLSGVEVAQALRQDEATRSIPVMILTASVDNIAEKVVQAQASDFLLKPFDYKELLAKVEILAGKP